MEGNVVMSEGRMSSSLWLFPFRLSCFDLVWAGSYWIGGGCGGVMGRR